MTSTRPDEASEAPRGGVFFDRESGEFSADASLFIDLYAIQGLRRQLLSTSEAIGSGSFDVKARPLAELALRSEADFLAETIRKAQGAVLLLAVRDDLRRYTRIERLLQDYGREVVEVEDGPPVHVLGVPTNLITAATGLPYEYTEGKYDPTLMLRIKTSTDNPTILHDVSQPKHVREEPSVGEWHTIPLQHVDIMLVDQVFLQSSESAIS